MVFCLCLCFPFLKKVFLLRARGENEFPFSSRKKGEILPFYCQVTMLGKIINFLVLSVLEIGHNLLLSNLDWEGVFFWILESCSVASFYLDLYMA